MATEILRPNAAGDEENILTPPDPNNHWAYVDEVEADDDTTAVATNSTTYQRDLYNLGVHSGSGTINKITVYVRCKAYTIYTVNQASAIIAIKTGGTAYESTAITLTNDVWTTHSNIWAVNPKTGVAWTWDDMDALQAGISLRRCTSNKTSFSYCTQVYVEVDHTPHADIDVGAEPVDRGSSAFAGTTYIDTNNPANTSGTLHSVKVYAATNITGLRVGTFYTTGVDTLKCRDSQLIGDVEAGAERTFTGLSITVQEGDYIGCYFTGGYIERDLSGFAGIWTKYGEYIDPGDEVTYSTNPGDAISLYGYGDIGAPPAYYHGLKVQGEGELALCDVGTHPLRIRKGGVTYGIELVNTDDPNASRIRIKTPSGIKAIRKYT